MRAFPSPALMQAVQAPATVTVPGATAPAGAAPVVSGPSTAIELRELNARRSEISRQLSNVESRRSDLATQLRNAAPGTDRAGLEGRIAGLDQRIIELEADLAVTGRQLASARGVAATIQDPPSPPSSGMLDSDQITGISIVFTLAVLMPISIAFARAILKRAKGDAERPSAQLVERLDRMENGIEAIAIEVERISEGQRFVTKVIGQGSAPAFSAGGRAGEPAAALRGERVDSATGR